MLVIICSIRKYTLWMTPNITSDIMSLVCERQDYETLQNHGRAFVGKIYTDPIFIPDRKFN